MADAYSLLMAQAIEAYPNLTAREAYTRFMQCMSKADLPTGETRRGPIVVYDNGNQWEYVAAKNVSQSLRRRYPFLGDVNRRLELSNLAGAKRGSEESTAAASKKRAKQVEKASERRQNSNVEQGRSRCATGKLDGSKGGTGERNHGGLTQATKESEVVKAARKLLAPPGSSSKEMEAGRLAAAEH